MTVNCHLPGATVDVEEGIEFAVGPFDAKQMVASRFSMCRNSGVQ
jgi:hypothetical protein